MLSGSIKSGNARSVSLVRKNTVAYAAMAAHITLLFIFFMNSPPHVILFWLFCFLFLKINSLPIQSKKSLA